MVSATSGGVPPESAAVALAFSDAWRVERSGSTLVVQAGADRVHELPGLDDAEISLVEGWFGGAPINTAAHPRGRVIADLLLQVGALRLEVTADSLPLVIHWAGAPLPHLRNALHACLGDQLVDETDRDAASGIAVVVRTTATWMETFVVCYALLQAGRAHLLCDLAYHDRVTIGPLVVPGQTACVECLGGRIAHRWGDPQPPTMPNATQAGSFVVAGAVTHALRDLCAGDPLPYVASCVVIDLATMESQSTTVTRSPWCTSCAAVPTPSIVSMPWDVSCDAAVLAR